MKNKEEQAHDFAIAVINAISDERVGIDDIVKFRLELYKSAFKQFSNSQDDELNDRIESGNFSF